MSAIDTKIQPVLTTHSTQRSDIQTLRALAVLTVVLYHFWPKRLTGGFVGVDVFFVISGFLITSHLISKPPSGIRSITQFWARRVRRLLPLSFTVLLTTLSVTLLVAPVTTLKQSIHEILASTFYIENWLLATQAVDYSAADNAASPVQHFWSLSLEEQFYFFWPILVFISVTAAGVLSASRRLILSLVLGSTCIFSFLYAVQLSSSSPGSAYFVTTTRVWELAAGGLVALLIFEKKRIANFKPVLRIILSWIGISMILWSAIWFDADTSFPGPWALLPVLGTAIVIYADAPKNNFSSPISYGNNKFVQHLGNVSYGIYLWHWPVVILLPYIMGHSIRWPEKILAIIFVILLATVTERHIEQRFRGSDSFGGSSSGAFRFMVIGLFVLSAAGALALYGVSRAEIRAEAASRAALANVDECFAGSALVTEGCDPHGTSLLTAPEFSREDKPSAYADDCWVLGNFSEWRHCQYGVAKDDAQLRIALVGNSHAGHWLPALEKIAEVREYSIDTYLISECYTVRAAIEFETSEKTANCQRWNEHVIESIDDGDYDLLVTSQRTWRPLLGVTQDEQQSRQVQAYEDLLKELASEETAVLVLRDTPYADVPNVPDCIAENLDSLEECDGGRDREVPDPLADAARKLSNDHIKLVDLTDRICRADTCYSTVGGVAVYFDAGHLSATFATSLSPEISEAILELTQ